MFRYGLLGLLVFLMSACDTIITPDTNMVTAGLSAEVKEIFDGLYVGHTITENKKDFFLAFERVDDSNRMFWEHYVSESRTIAETLEKVPRFYFKGQHDRIAYDAEDNPTLRVYPKTMQKILGFDRAKYDSLIEYIRANSTGGYDAEDGTFGSYGKLFGAVVGGLAGMFYVTRPAPNTEIFVIYGSDKPINKRTINSDYKASRTFFENFGHIIISMSGIDYLNAPVVANYGITKNVTSFFSKDSDKFPGVSMILHGFSAVVWLKFFKDKKYMSTTPIGKMGEIMESKLNKDAVFLDHFPDDLEKLRKAGLFIPLTSGTGRLTTVKLKELSELYVPAL